MFPNVEVLFALEVLTPHAVDAQATVTSTQAINLPTARPKNVFNVPGDFPSMGFELAFLPGYGNEFSANMIGETADRMGEKPLIRIGGTSGDIIKYNPNQEIPADCLENDVNKCTHKSKFILGLNYFDALSKRIKDARISILAPLDPIHSTNPPNTANIVEFLKEAYKSIGASRIDAIALGDEKTPQFDDKSLDITEHLLDHTDLVANFAKYRPSIDYALNTAEESTYFANTLWARALWIPLLGLATPGPRVQAPFYVMPFVADFLGKRVSRERGAVNIDLRNPHLTTYAMYEGDEIARVAIVNLLQYGREGNRSGVEAYMRNLVITENVVSVGRLHADDGTAAGG
ncbi:glycoside hydrolase family 79 protein [Lentithecium fluviatile CBS 122367]|uniref:Glycoside hydrolase family 79 protein n=1 Tax=Lentithecium fluviatile CBS 122367 TaxID=1168545 RepID=A0A6G1II08_9PLEO|nr:glycoside hydrolase family 79 protein [Lentithecium fluviatile CBS 122367]